MQSIAVQIPYHKEGCREERIAMLTREKIQRHFPYEMNPNKSESLLYYFKNPLHNKTTMDHVSANSLPLTYLQPS